MGQHYEATMSVFITIFRSRYGTCTDMTLDVARMENSQEPTKRVTGNRGELSLLLESNTIIVPRCYLSTRGFLRVMNLICPSIGFICIAALKDMS